MAHESYTIEGMDCADCARKIERGVGRLDGVRAARVDFMTGTLRVSGGIAPDALRERVAALGYTLAAAAPAAETPALPPPAQVNALAGFARFLMARRETRGALIGGALMVSAFILDNTVVSASIANALYIIATLVMVRPIARSGLNNLRINRDFNIDLLMTIAAVGATFIGEMLEAATVIFLFAVGEALEGYTAERARHSLRSLMALAPQRALRIVDGREVDVPVEALQPGDVIVVRPGERVAMDGVVIEGAGGVNQAPITGESIPVYKSAGEDVFAGSVNGDGALQVRVTGHAADNTLSRIIRLVEEAQSARAPSQRFIDRFAHTYTPAVVGVAALVAVVPPLLLDAPFFDTPDGRGWLYRALALLVIACPCALVISTPVTIISALTAAVRCGVLIKGGAYLEALGRVKVVAFDKTGTLTHGRPVVAFSHAVDCEGGSPCAACDDVLALASAVEQRSAHPLARAVVDAAQARGVAGVYHPAQAVESLAGRGVQGRVGGRLVTVGSHALFDADYPHSRELCLLVDEAEANGHTAMLLSDGERVRGFIAVSDETRADNPAVIGELKALGLRTAILTGDNATVAEALARGVGVDDVQAALLPADKADAVQKLLREYGAVAMVGDGINDAPALATATVGIAMGGAGSAQALETADVALMADDLWQLPFAVRLSRFARRLIMQNVGLSLGLKAAFILLALFGAASLWLAILADVGMSLLVTLNGMRPLRMTGRDPQPATVRPGD